MVWFFFLLPFLAFRFFIPSPYNRVPCPQTSVKRTLLREHHFLPIAGLAIDLARGGKVLLHAAVAFLTGRHAVARKPLVVREGLLFLRCCVPGAQE